MAKQWVNGSRAMVTVNSIFAGFSGALLFATFRDAANCVPHISDITHIGSSLLAGVALITFALAAEWITDALDEAQVGKYIWSMQAHNIGVMCALGALCYVLFLNGWSSPYCLLPLLPALKWFKDFVELATIKGRKDYKVLIDVDER